MRYTRVFLLPAAFLVVLTFSCLGQDVAPPKGNGDAVQQRFDLLDTDRDGVLTIEEVGRPRLFQRLDANGDGVVTPDEAVTFFEARSPRFQSARPEQRAAVQGDGSGIRRI